MEASVRTISFEENPARGEELAIKTNVFELFLVSRGTGVCFRQPGKLAISETPTFGRTNNSLLPHFSDFFGEIELSFASWKEIMLQIFLF